MTMDPCRACPADTITSRMWEPDNTLMTTPDRAATGAAKLEESTSDYREGLQRVHLSQMQRFDASTRPLITVVA